MGAGGLVVAVLAYRRTISMIGDTRSAVHRLLNDDRRGIDPRAVRDVAVVRYDALREMSGELSFSLALLDAAGDGVVITSINGRSETRTYAKAIEGGKGVQQLSPEEWRVVRDARLGKGPGRYATAPAPDRQEEPEHLATPSENGAPTEEQRAEVTHEANA
ncbi:MAG: DUF4446 family protein [Streptosporangiales bacterium]|nr:DUF4446 family protein [Streptosporangiales bacterium]